jgi:ABC-type bacteriocin/lantibiotic exporter with double-glycine peptidase domain
MKNLFKSHKIGLKIEGQVILKQLALNIKQGEFLAILGPSGSGKSTLLRMLNNLYSSSSGDIYYDDKPMGEYDIQTLRREVAFLLQTPVMFRGSVKKNLLRASQWYPDRDTSLKTLVKILEDVGLNQSFLEKEAQSLSGGEKQRLALARLLLNKPKVLLLDEPTANLDPAMAQRILNRIKKLQESYNLTVVMVSHDHGLVKNYANRIAFLIDGNIVAISNSNNVEDIKNEAVISFVKESRYEA